MKLVHYDNKEITLNLKYERSSNRALPFMKPDGLWVSVENEYGWWDRCLDNSFGLDGLTHIHDVALRPDARILHLTNSAEIIAFHKNYCFDMLSIVQDRTVHPSDAGHTMMMIAWENVAEDYQGIIISPYLQELRWTTEMMWYYAGDCASGCIWDYPAIESITLRKIVPQPKGSYDSNDDDDDRPSASTRHSRESRDEDDDCVDRESAGS